MKVVFVSKSSRFSIENNQSSLLCCLKTLIMAKPQQQTSDHEVSRIMKFGVTKICVTFNKSNQDTDESKIL